jgi:hypothetical protein
LPNKNPAAGDDGASCGLKKKAPLLGGASQTPKQVCDHSATAASAGLDLIAGATGDGVNIARAAKIFKLKSETATDARLDPSESRRVKNPNIIHSLTAMPAVEQ